MLSDQKYEFRVVLSPKLGPKTGADMSMTFVREDDLSQEERDTLSGIADRGTVVVREKQVPVLYKGHKKPGEATKEIQKQLPFEFTLYGHFVRAWQILEVRPLVGDAHPERTKEKYCIYDEGHKDYLYTEAFIKRVVSEVETETKFEQFFGKPPTLLHPTGVTLAG